MSHSVVYDVTDLFQIRQQLRQLIGEQEAMLDNDMVGIAKLRDRRIFWKNRALERIFGYGPGELLSQPTAMLYTDANSFKEFGREAYPILAVGQRFRKQLEMKRRGGDPIWIDLNGMYLEGSEGETLWLLQDVTEMKQYQAQVEHIAFHDILTRLPNRLLLADRMRQAFALDARMNTMTAVCYLDPNGFKPINDKYGHETGDLLLKEVALRLLLAMRSNDTVARVGGDEFVLLLTALQEPEEANDVLNRVKHSIELPWNVPDGASINISGSIGVAFNPRDGKSPSHLLKMADEAMYEAKHSKNAKRILDSWSPDI